MIVLIFCVLLLLGIKLLYNLSVPYQLLARQDENKGISVMVIVEWILLALALVLSFWFKPDSSFLQFRSLLIVGAGSIAATYLHFVAVMLVGGWLSSRWHK